MKAGGAAKAPGCMFVNVHVGENGQQGTLFLENPRGNGIQSAQDLELQVRSYILLRYHISYPYTYGTKENKCSIQSIQVSGPIVFLHKAPQMNICGRLL